MSIGNRRYPHGAVFTYNQDSHTIYRMPLATCTLCKKEFYRKLSQIKLVKHSYCSSFCQHRARRTGNLIKCYWCGSKIYKQFHDLSIKNRKFFCGKKCGLEWLNSNQKGVKHPNWTTGEFSYKGVLLRHKVLRECSLCRIKDKRVLAVHHIDRNRKNNHISNLAWLCHDCHFLVHHYPSEHLRFIRHLKKDKRYASHTL